MTYAIQIKVSRYLRLFAAFLLASGLIAAAQAANEHHHVNVDADGFSIGRYDPVAYFTEGRPIQGRRELSAEHRGAKYAFASPGNRALFLEDPDRFVPQYGGYCAYGLVHGSKSDVDPEVWAIVDGKLYLMISGGTRSVWQKRKKAYIQIADNAWKSITAN